VIRLIKTKNKIVGTIKTKNVLQGVISPAELKIYPELEDLEITPYGVEQNFKSEKYYGYDNIKVKAVESETLEITPTEEEQQITGLFGIVNVNKIPEKYVVPKINENTLILSRGKVKGGVLSI
jgi:hypothetical protein